MSRHLQVLRKAKLDAELFARQARPAGEPRAAPRPRDRRASSHDQWQQLVHELFLRCQNGGARAIGLAAATAGEGTSYVARHLASELARVSDQATLLLEANVYRPTQAERHAVEPDPGLRRLLAEKDWDIENCLRQTALANFWVLPAGSASAPTAGTPDWTHFTSAFERLRRRFPGIVVDLPPVNLSTDALIVSPLLDGTVLVVEADLCSREAIQNAADRLRRAAPNLLGTILNKRKFVIPDAVYRRL